MLVCWITFAGLAHPSGFMLNPCLLWSCSSHIGQQKVTFEVLKCIDFYFSQALGNTYNRTFLPCCCGLIKVFAYYYLDSSLCLFYLFLVCGGCHRWQFEHWSSEACEQHYKWLLNDLTVKWRQGSEIPAGPSLRGKL